VTFDSTHGDTKKNGATAFGTTLPFYTTLLKTLSPKRNVVHLRRDTNNVHNTAITAYKNESNLC
jgi:hypothetical protein